MAATNPTDPTDPGNPNTNASSNSNANAGAQVDEQIPDDLLATVRRCVAESLAAPPANVHLQSRLIDDLGADSLDFVDIVFMLDRELDIRVRETEFNFLTRLDFSSPEVMKGAHLTEAVVSRLAEWLPPLRVVPDRTKVTPRELFSLITIESICLVCLRALAAAAAAKPPA